MGGHPPTNFSYGPKDAQENFASFDTNVAAVGDSGKMVSNEKLTKNRKLRGLKLRGFRLNQMSIPYFIYQIDHGDEVDTIGDFENETPTHMSATHAISKIEQKSQNRTPRELDQKFGIPRIGMIH